MYFKARSLFKFRGRNIRPGFAKWRERYRRGSFLRYYVQRPAEDTRSVLGKRLDILVGLLLAWLAGFFLLVNFTGRPLVALALSMLLMAGEALIFKKWWELREKRRRLRRQVWLAGQKFMEDILKLDPRKEFPPYVRDILAGLPGFQEIRLKEEKKKGGAGDKQGVDLEGVYKGVPVAVRCKCQEGDKKVDPEDIRAFAGALRLGGYKNGLFVTSGEFGDGVLRVVEEAVRRGINIKPVDRYRLMDLARQAGSGAFRREDVTSPAIPGTTGERLENALIAFRDLAFGSRKKARSYFLYGLLLYGGHILLKDSSMLGLFYLFFAVLNFLMGAGSLLFGKTLEEIDPLEGLEPEK